MTDKTSFEQWWIDQHPKYKPSAFSESEKDNYKSTWNAAIDAAISKCEEVRKDNVYCDSEYGAIFCKEEIQKLRSE